ncbi:T9SS type A sorting domain-containing protein [candidate division KSB1 bacterium]|nr:T9SS type A sorting domain-containing protein [candidate division KSB1 bacterium]
MQKLTTILLLILSVTSLSQTYFMRTYGENDFSSNVVCTADGGFLVSGWSKAGGLGGWDTYLLKTDAKGDVVWDQYIGGSGDDQIEGLVETVDGHFILALFTTSGNAEGADIQLLKFDSAGNKQWTQNYRWEKDERCNAVVQLQDGGFVIAGQTNSFTVANDCFLIRTDSDGNKLCETVHEDFNSNDDFRDVIATPDGGYALIGTRSNSFYLEKYSSDNTFEWAKKYGGGQACRGMSLLQLDDGGYIVVGFTGTWNTVANADALVIRTDAQGNEMWNKKFGGDKSDLASLVKRTPDGNVVFVGRSASFSDNGSYDIYLVKIDLDGTLLWQRTFDSGMWDEGFGLDVCEDGGLIIAGSQIPGTTYDNGKMWLIRTNQEGIVPGVNVEQDHIVTPETPALYQNYPNPFNPSTTIQYTLAKPSRVSLTIHNCAGQIVRKLVDEQQNAGLHSYGWDATDEHGSRLSSGIYLYRIAIDNLENGKSTWQEQHKMLLVK